MIRLIRGTCWILLSLVLFPAGCSDPKIDGTSDGTFQASIEAMKIPLSETDRQQLDRALQGLEYLFSENALSVLADSSRIKERMRTRLEGLTVQEVLTLWDERRNRTIEELEEKKAQTEVALEQLKDIVVQKARYYVQKGHSVVELKVQNNTEHTISRVYFHGELISSGRHSPWVEDDFNYKIPEGLAPEKSETWNFALLSAVWENVPKNRKDLKLHVTVTRIDGEDNEPIYDAYTNQFSKRDQERLKTLKSYQTERVAEGDES